MCAARSTPCSQRCISPTRRRSRSAPPRSTSSRPFFLSSRRRHTRWPRDWSSDVCSSDLIVLTAKAARAQLKVPGPLRDLWTTITPSGRVGTLVAAGPAADTEVKAGDVRRLLGLRSTWFRVGVLALAKPEAPLEPGHQLTLSGIARGLRGVTLEQRAAGSPWAPLAKVKPNAGGGLAVAVKPTVTTQYRLAAGNARSEVVRLVVAHPPAQGGVVRP